MLTELVEKWSRPVQALRFEEAARLRDQIQAVGLSLKNSLLPVPEMTWMSWVFILMPVWPVFMSCLSATAACRSRSYFRKSRQVLNGRNRTNFYRPVLSRGSENRSLPDDILLDFRYRKKRLWKNPVSVCRPADPYPAETARDRARYLKWHTPMP